MILATRDYTDTVRSTGVFYPARLQERLSNRTSGRLAVLGELKLSPLINTAFFCSTHCPGDVILAAYDQAARWRDERRCIIGGFHSPIEEECLRILLRGHQPIVVCLARGLDGMRLPADWKKPLTDGRLLLLSPFSAKERRVTRNLAVERNRIVAALADEIVFAHITPGGELDELRRLVSGWGVPFRVLSAELAKPRPGDG
jgi:hypothetical protein